MHEKSNRKVQKSILMTETCTNILFLMKTKNGHILTFSDKMQISVLSCCATCDWFCPMTSHILFNILYYSYVSLYTIFKLPFLRYKNKVTNSCD